MSDNQYSVVQFFEDDTYEYVRRFVSAKEAVMILKHYTNSVAVKLGMVSKVIITDGGDCVCFEWTKDKGITFPPKEELEKMREEIKVKKENKSD